MKKLHKENDSMTVLKVSMMSRSCGIDHRSGGWLTVKSTNEKKKRARERAFLYNFRRSVRALSLTKRGSWKIPSCKSEG
jgi:hypothetical protein